MKFKRIIFILLLINSHLVFSCGDYLVKAKVVMNNGFSTLVINPNTKSEINLTLEAQEADKLNPYIGRFIQTTATIEKKMDYTLGQVARIGTIQVIVPDPLSAANGTKFELIKKVKCKK